MRNRKTIMRLGLLVAVLFLAIGYAAISNIDLAISATASAEVDTGLFRVAFDKKAEKTTTSNTGTTATVTARVTGDQSAEFGVTGLKNKNETVSATYTIVNSSESLNAELSKPIVTLSGNNTDLYEVTAVYGNGSEETPIIESGDSITLTVTVKLQRTPMDLDNDVKPATINISFSSTPVQPDTPNIGGSSSVRLPETEDPLYYGKYYATDVDNAALVFYEDGSVAIMTDCFVLLAAPEGYIEYNGNQIIANGILMGIISSDKKTITLVNEDGSESGKVAINGNGTCVRTPTQYDDLPMMLENNSIFSVLYWENEINTSDIKTITLGTTINVPQGVQTFDLSIGQNGKVIGYVTPNAGNSGYYDLHIQGDGALYAPENSSDLFSYGNLTQLNNLNLLNTKYVKNMRLMFSNVDLTSIDLSNFDTSKVTNMYGMFQHAEYLTSLDVSNLDTRKVTDMSWMFYRTGYESTEFTLKLGNNFDTSKVTDMSYMFRDTGYKSTKFTLDLGDKFNTSNVTDMSYMFERTGYSSTEFTLDLGNNFDTSNVTNMSSMFEYAGYNSTKFTLDCSNWNVDKVNYYYDFNYSVEDKVNEPIWKK